MRKSLFATIVCAILVACGGTGGVSTGSTTVDTAGDILGTVLGNAANGTSIANVVTSVLGLDKLSERELYGTWHYRQPGCAFISEGALTKAGGEVAAANVKKELESYYSSIGINSSNTTFTFSQDGKVNVTLLGKSLNGKYTYNKSDGSLTIKIGIISKKAYVKRNGISGLSYLFDADALLTVFQAVTALSGNSTLSTIGDISKKYDGVRIGFDMTK